MPSGSSGVFKGKELNRQLNRYLGRRVEITKESKKRKEREGERGGTGKEERRKKEMIYRGHIFLTLVCFKTCINSTTCHTINVSQKHWKLISMLLIT